MVLLLLPLSMTTNMAIKLETNEPGPISNPSQTPTPTLVPASVDKKPIIVVRANEAQLAILNASFAQTESPKKAELDRICTDTGLYVFYIYLNPPEMP
jgi:hypothetical protein